MKPWYLRPELYAAIVGNVIAILMATGTLTPEQSSTLTQAVNSVVGGILSMVSIFGMIHAQNNRNTSAAKIVESVMYTDSGYLPKDGTKVAVSSLDNKHAKACDLVKTLGI